MSQPLEITNLLANALSVKTIAGIDYKDIPFTPYNVEGRQGVSIFSLYNTRDIEPDGPAAAIARYDAGARTPRHHHPGWELLLVLEGELIDDRGRHGPGVLQLYPPDSSHELSSDAGCIFLVVWEKPVVPVQSTSSRAAA
jgi:anti-sigma factor ChrR (cupin superfamily)